MGSQCACLSQKVAVLSATRCLLPFFPLPSLPLIALVVALSLQGAAQPLCWAIVVPGHWLTQHQKSLRTSRACSSPERCLGSLCS